MLFFRGKKAFSLIEVSIVIVIIGLLIAGVVGSKHIIKKARINAAQAITRSSPINSIAGNKLWLDTALAEVSLGGASSTGDAINSWQNNANNQNPITVSRVGSGPTYSNSINSIQAIKFDSNSASNHLEIENPEFLNDTDYTIMITEKRMGTNSGGGNYLLNSSTGFAIGYQSGTSIIQTHGEAASAANQSSVESLTEYQNKPRVIMFTHSSDEGNKIYINGTLANEDSSSAAKTHLTGLSSSARLKIGNNYNGEIGEIAIFDKALKTVDRKVVEDYATDKWNAPNNRDQVGDCTSGIVLSTGCEPSCTIAEVGISYSGLRATTGNSTTANCNGTNFKTSDSVTYTCVDGVTTILSGSCSCIDNYVLISGECVPQAPCTTDLPIAGSTVTSVDHGSTDPIACNAPGYTGSSTGYNCNHDTFTAGTACTCESGRDITTNCVDCLDGYTEVGGTCLLDCTIPNGTTGITDGTKVAQGTTEIDCNNGTHEGKLTYSCGAGAVYSEVVNNCAIPPAYCNGGATSNSAVTGYRRHVFRSNGNLNCTVAGNIEILVVAGGGGGGGYLSGGGGAGGLVYQDVYMADVANYSIKVGAGGIGGQNGGLYANVETDGKPGGNSIFDDNALTSKITAFGGGGGAYNSGTAGIVDGGSGGGGNRRRPNGEGVDGQGHDGGSTNGGGWDGGGGGGGAGGVGGAGGYKTGGSGGQGKDYSAEFGTDVGDSGFFASGGGGAGDLSGNSFGSASAGGGGDGGDRSNAPQNGAANTGGGGGGKAGWGSPGVSGNAANGGSGVVIVRYRYP